TPWSLVAVTAQRPDKHCQHAKRCHTSNMDKQGLKPHRTKAYIETALAREISSHFPFPDSIFSLMATIVKIGIQFVIIFYSEPVTVARPH
ncbi:uncharacterized protein ASPGLDRAFT_49708, partial [Aspergillus glaucus CBS 516.65]